MEDYVAANHSVGESSMIEKVCFHQFDGETSHACTVAKIRSGDANAHASCGKYFNEAPADKPGSTSDQNTIVVVHEV
jgi:hypothetical protein